MTAFAAPIAQDESIGASYTSPWINVRSFTNFAIQYWLTDASTANGSITFQVSCEDTSFIATRSGEAAIANFVTHPITIETLDAIAIASGEPSGGLVEFRDAAWKWIRLVYTRSSGSGTLNAVLTAKAGVP